VSHRAFYSLRKVGIEADDVRMAVCVMRVVPARYAFVIHTKNPSNNDANEVRQADPLHTLACGFGL
jgi:alpha-glucan,water dikinase